MEMWKKVFITDVSYVSGIWNDGKLTVILTDNIACPLGHYKMQ